MFQRTNRDLDQTRGHITWLEKRMAELEAEVASLPTVGFHRPKYLLTRKSLKRVRRALEEEREYRDWLVDLAQADEEMEKYMSPEQVASWKEFETEQHVEEGERMKRAKEALKRRANFYVIDGDKE